MAVGWGVDLYTTPEGEKSGTDSDAVRRVWGALYSPGVISGCEVSTTTNMQYSVRAGVVAVQVTDNPRQCVMVPVNGGLINAPSNSSAHTDILFVEQPIDPNAPNIATLRVDTTAPANSQIIAKYRVPANANSTASAVLAESVPYSVPYGANLGIFYSHTDTSNTAVPTTSTTIAMGTINLQTDRKLSLTLNACLSAQNAYRFDNNRYCEVAYDVFINGTKSFTWRTPGLHQAWGTYYFEEFRNFQAGTHEISYKIRNSTGPGTPLRHFAGSDSNTGTSFNVRDAGFWESIGHA